MAEEKSSGKQKTLLIVLLTIFGLSVVGVIGIVAFRLGQTRPEVTPPPAEGPTITVSPASEISPIPNLTETGTLEPTTPPAETESDSETKSDEDKIRQVLADKYDRTVEETEVSVSKNIGTHASGSVRFAGEMGGGMWLAYKDGDNWIITYDGHGTIPCSAVNNPYNFPTDMAPECWNETTNSLITR